jgi:hypothetical protein
LVSIGADEVLGHGPSFSLQTGGNRGVSARAPAEPKCIDQCLVLLVWCARERRGGHSPGAEATPLQGSSTGDTAVTMSAENVEAVRELFDRFGEIEFERLREALETSSSLPEAAPKMGDLGRWHLDRLHARVELDASALPAVPEGNRARGHQGWFEFWRSWLIPWERFEYAPKRWHDAGDRVVVESVQRGRLASGLEYSTPIFNVWTFEGEQVIRLQMFLTWDEAMEAAQRQ